MTLWNKCQKMAAELDKIKPDWYKKINLERFDIKMCPNCIIGQVFPEEYITGYTAPNFITEIWKKEALGWASIKKENEWLEEKLDKYWRILIKQRREND